jgi:hypothetical protein
VTGGGGSQTPWTSDIDAANHSLNSVFGIGIGSAAGGQGLNIQQANPTVQLSGSSNAENAAVQLAVGTVRW